MRSEIQVKAKKYVNENKFPQVPLNKDVLNINGIIPAYNDVLTITGTNVEQTSFEHYIWTRNIKNRTKCCIWYLQY